VTYHLWIRCKYIFIMSVCRPFCASSMFHISKCL